MEIALIILGTVLLYLLFEESRRAAKMQAMWEDAAKRLIAIRTMVDVNEVDTRVSSIRDMYDKVYAEAISKLIAHSENGAVVPSVDIELPTTEETKEESPSNYHDFNLAMTAYPHEVPKND